jgi:hypothetical protein
MTIHIHVGSNIPGYLPESDVTCFDSIEDALEALRHEIKDQQDYYYENCTMISMGPEALEIDSCECAWCDVASDAEAALSAITDSGPDEHFVREGRASWIFSPPEGADIHHWAFAVVDDATNCEIFADQEGYDDSDRSCGCGADGVHGVDHGDFSDSVGDAGTGHGAYEYRSGA